MPDTTLEQFRTSLKFSLWAWAAYWPGGGLILLVGGMSDPISIAIALAAAAGFFLVFATGVLDNTGKDAIQPSEWLLKRPIYLLVLFALFLAAGNFIPSAANGAFFLFSGVYVASLVLAIVRLRNHLVATQQGLFASRADQAFLLLGATAFMAAAVFLDTIVPGGLGWPAAAIGVFNWIQLAFPALVLVAAAPFRAKLTSPFGLSRRQPKPQQEKLPATR